MSWRARARTPKRDPRGPAARERRTSGRGRVVVPVRGRAAKGAGAEGRRDPAPHWRAWFGTVAGAAAVVAILAAFTWLRVEAIDLGYRVQEKTREIEALTERRRALVTEYEMLRAPARLEALAAGSLGLVPPRPDQIRYLR